MRATTIGRAKAGRRTPGARDATLDVVLQWCEIIGTDARVPISEPQAGALRDLASDARKALADTAAAGGFGSAAGRHAARLSGDLARLAAALITAVEGAGRVDACLEALASYLSTADYSVPGDRESVLGEFRERVARLPSGAASGTIAGRVDQAAGEVRDRAERRTSETETGADRDTVSTPPRPATTARESALLKQLSEAAGESQSAAVAARIAALGRLSLAAVEEVRLQLPGLPPGAVAALCPALGLSLLAPDDPEARTARRDLVVALAPQLFAEDAPLRAAVRNTLRSWGPVDPSLGAALGELAGGDGPPRDVGLDALLEADPTLRQAVERLRAFPADAAAESVQRVVSVWEGTSFGSFEANKLFCKVLREFLKARSLRVECTRHPRKPAILRCQKAPGMALGTFMFEHDSRAHAAGSASLVPRLQLIESLPDHRFGSK